jgi:hypothetical protein
MERDRTSFVSGPESMCPPIRALDGQECSGGCDEPCSQVEKW